MEQTGATAAARGRCAEEIAAQWLALSGLVVLDRNRRAADGEVDLVARDGNTLVFVEVRCRRRGAWVGAPASIDARKWGRLCRCARRLATEEALRWPGRTLRIDAIVLELGAGELKLRHLRNLTGPASGR